MEELPNMTEALLQILNSAIDATDFIKGEIPDVIDQLLTWKLVSSLLYMTMGAVMMLPILTFLKKSFRTWVMDHPEGGAPVTVAGIAPLFIVGLIMACTHLSIVLQIWLAPKIYLIEYASDLIK